jgi:superkiller protein 3
MKRLSVLFASAVLLAQQPSLESAWNLLAKGQRDQAARVARQVIAANPRNGEAHLFLGSILAEDGSNLEALTQLKEAVRLLPRSAEAHNALGDVLFQMGDTKTARTEFERTVALDPGFSDAHARLGLILLQEGDSKNAAAHLDKAIAGFGNSPDAAHSYYLRAKIFTNAEQVEKAEADLKRALALRPDFPEAWSDLGQARKALLDDDGALEAFRKSVQLDPRNAIAQYRLGAELLKRGEGEDAETHLRESYRLDPKNQSTLYSLQMVLNENGKTAEAARIKQELAAVLKQIDEESQSAFTALRLNNEGAALEKAGDLRGAAAKYREAIALDPEHVGFRLNLGVALLRLGQWKEGLDQLRESVRRDPDNTLAKTALSDALEQAPVEFGGKGKPPAKRK